MRNAGVRVVSCHLTFHAFDRGVVHVGLLLCCNGTVKVLQVGGEQIRQAIGRHLVAEVVLNSDCSHKPLQPLLLRRARRL